ncbi:MAG: hypothetical protein KTR16_01600 [Acidiferrobacterales bacterium]|nr:hypothetical protein [Acidiferrobacterales bacterium]
MASKSKTDIINKLRFDFPSAARDARNQWKSRVALPFVSTFESARKNYESVIKRAEENRKKQLELVFMGLSLVGGTAITAALGGAIRTAMGRGLLNTICENNLSSAFSAYSMVANSNFANFALNNVLDNVKAQSLAKLKAGLEQQLKKPAMTLTQEPWALYASLGIACDQAETSVNEVAMRASHPNNVDHIDQKELESIYTKLMASPFMCPPQSSPYLEADKRKIAAQRLELIFYLKDILNSDKLFRENVPQDKRNINIEVLPGHKNYPKNMLRAAKPWEQRPGAGDIHYEQRVNYGFFDQVIVDRINKLYKEELKKEVNLIDSWMGGEHTKPDIILKAKSALDEVIKKNRVFFTKGQSILKHMN